MESTAQAATRKLTGKLSRISQMEDILKRFDFARECPHNRVYYVGGPLGLLSVRIVEGSGGGVQWVLSQTILNKPSKDLAHGYTSVTLATELAKQLVRESNV